MAVDPVAAQPAPVYSVNPGFPSAYSATNPTALPGTAAATDIGTPGISSALVALPANLTTTPTPGTSNFTKFYTFSVSLREGYDSNLSTSNSGNNQGSMVTSINPSVVVSFPVANGTLAASYNVSGSYYSQTGGGSDGSFQYSQSLVAQYARQFGERFSLSVSDGFTDSPEPNLLGSTGTPYRDGQNVSNAFNTSLTAQWTPLFGTSTSYANTIVNYLDGGPVATNQNSVENTGSQSFSLSILPRLSANVGGVVDDTTYNDVTRGYTSYTLFVGTQWQALPNVSASVRGGASATQTTAGNNDNSSNSAGIGSISPYAALSLSWQIGARSSVGFDYSHEITPTDQVNANAQGSDRFSASISYQINPVLSTTLQGIYTYSTISSQLIASHNLNSYSESDYGLTSTLGYHFGKYFETSLDIGISGVSSEIADRDYARDQIGISISGSY